MCGYTVVTYPIGMCSAKYQVFMGFLNLWLCRNCSILGAIAWLVFTTSANAITCYPPRVPFVPDDPIALLEFADLIKKDFEDYIADVQDYFRCLDTARARAYEEAREVSEQYWQFLQDTSQ